MIAYLVEAEEKEGSPEGFYHEIIAVYLDKTKANERALLAQEENERIYRFYKGKYPKEEINKYDKEDDGYNELVYNVVEFEISE